MLRGILMLVRLRYSSRRSGLEGRTTRFCCLSFWDFLCLFVGNKDPMPFDYPARRTRIARALGLTNEVLLIGAGQPIPKPEISDALLPFIAHQEYYYLTGHTE